MAAKLVKWSAIKSITGSTGKVITIGFAESTDAWKRPSSYPSTQTIDEFVKVTEQNQAQLPANTAVVAMKESEHQSDRDQRMHYTAFCQDSQGQDLPTQHFVFRK